MEFILYGFVVLVVVSVLGGIYRFFYFIVQTKNVIESANKLYSPPNITNSLGMYGGGYGDNDFAMILSQLNTMMRQHNNGQMSENEEIKMNILMGETVNHFQDMSSLAQKKHDMQVSGMVSYAASNGLDWNPY